MNALKMMLCRLTLAAGETAIDLEAGEGDDLALGAGFFGSLEEFVNQKAGVALISPVAAVDGENIHVFGSTLDYLLKRFDHFIFHSLIDFFSEGG
jgi:hypothetical protein